MLSQRESAGSPLTPSRRNTPNFQQCSLENFPDLASYGWFVVEIESLRPLNVMKLEGRPLLKYFLRFPLSKQNKSFCSFPFFFLCGFALKRSFVCKQEALAVYTPQPCFQHMETKPCICVIKHIYTILWLRPPDHQPGKCCGSAIFIFF